MWPFNKKKTQPILCGEQIREEVDLAMAELEAKTFGLDAIIHFKEAAWSLNLEEGKLSFIPENSIGKKNDDTPTMKAIAPVQVIGTFNTEDETFLWGWDHPSIDEPFAEHARKVKAYGEEHQLEPLTSRKVTCSEADCWEFTALACKLNEAQGAYRGPSDETLVFMTFGKVELVPEKPL